MSPHPRRVRSHERPSPRLSRWVTTSRGTRTSYPEDSAEMLLGAVKFDRLSPTDSEEFCFDLMSESGFINVDWRKGTPKPASPSDRGRDITAELERSDVAATSTTRLGSLTASTQDRRSTRRPSGHARLGRSGATRRGVVRRLRLPHQRGQRLVGRLPVIDQPRLSSSRLGDAAAPASTYGEDGPSLQARR